MESSLSTIEPFIGEIKTLLQRSCVVLPKKAEVKLYHHNGIEVFHEIGATFISVIQHDYCKFIVAMIPGQIYPYHYHRIKDESFFVLYGDLTVTIEDDKYNLCRGDIINVPRRFTHNFTTKSGCVFEEISTAYLQNDSVYEDKIIQCASRKMKTTILPIDIFF